MSITQTSARQIIDRDTLQQIFPNVSGQLLDLLLRSIDKDLTVPCRADASSTPDRVVTFNASVVNNSVSGRQKSIPHINSLIPSFTSGTVTFPPSTGGTVTVSPGSNIILTCPSNQYVKILVCLDSTGNLVVTQGTANAVEASALVPAPGANLFPISYISLFNNAGTISNIIQSKIFQFSMDGSSALANNSVTNAILAQMPAHTIKGNNTAGTANAADLTATQVTAELNNMVGDSGSGGTKGLVPAPAAGDTAANKFLKANGVWTVVSAGMSLLQTYSSPGSFPYVVPANKTVLTFMGVAAGGGGGSGHNGPPANGAGGGGGGGGGNWGIHTISVTPGMTLTIEVGTGGTSPATSSTPGGAGGNTRILDGATLLAAWKGGFGGNPGIGATPGARTDTNGNGGQGGKGGVGLTANGEDGFLGSLYRGIVGLVTNGATHGAGGGGGASYGDGGNGETPGNTAGTPGVLGGGGGGAWGNAAGTGDFNGGAGGDGYMEIYG